MKQHGALQLHKHHYRKQTTGKKEYKGILRLSYVKQSKGIVVFLSYHTLRVAVASPTLVWLVSVYSLVTSSSIYIYSSYSSHRQFIKGLQGENLHEALLKLLFNASHEHPICYSGFWHGACL